MGREALSKLNFLLFLNWVRGIFISTHVTEEMVKLILLSHFTLKTLKCLKSFRLYFNIRFVDKFILLILYCNIINVVIITYYDYVQLCKGTKSVGRI